MTLSLTSQILLAVVAWLILAWIGNSTLALAVGVGAATFSLVYRHL